MAPPREGHGLATEVALTVPPGSLEFWAERLARLGTEPGAFQTRFGERALSFTDPHGMPVALVESAEGMSRTFSAWRGGPIPIDKQVRGLESARLRERDLEPTATFLVEILGFTPLGTDGAWHRYGVAGGRSGCYVDIQAAPETRRGAWGVGSIHHLAWRVADGAHQLEVRQRVLDAGRRPTPVIDRFWFESVYFLEPGGVLFELATDGPGFAVDEDPAHLGETLVLPPWLEAQRSAIESVLPRVVPPSPEPVR
jgi:glyoxalase family protein